MGKTLIFVLLLSCNLLALNTLDTQTRNLTEEQKIEALNKWAPTSKHVIIKNALLTGSVQKY